MTATKYNILYVDDETDNLDVFESTFWKDYNIFLAISAQKGFDILEKENIHLVISDQRMPAITGVEFLEKVAEKYPEALRMILTGFSDMDTVIEAINKGKIYHYLTKPWKKKEFQEIINKALEVVRLKEENNLLLLTLQLSNKKLEALNIELEIQVQERTKKLEDENTKLTETLSELKNSIK
jgi:response regulator RpfG family c-di-GMP phosphodiesterase